MTDAISHSFRNIFDPRSEQFTLLTHRYLEDWRRALASSGLRPLDVGSAALRRARGAACLPPAWPGPGRFGRPNLHGTAGPHGDYDLSRLRILALPDVSFWRWAFPQ
jgi:hypothetical protein